MRNLRKKTEKSEETQYDKNLADYLTERGADNIYVPLIICDKDFHVCFSTGTLKKLIRNISDGMSIDKFIDTELLADLPSGGRTYQDCFRTTSKSYSVLAFRKHYVSDCYVLILLAGKELFFGNPAFGRIDMQYHSIICQIDSQIDALFDRNITAPCELLAENVQNLAHINRLAVMFASLIEKRSKKPSLVDISSFFRQLEYEGNACLSNGSIQLTFSNDMQSTDKLEADYCMAFYYFTLIILNLLMISLDGLVSLNVSTTDPKTTVVTCSTDIPRDLFANETLFRMSAKYPHSRLSLDELAVDLFGSNVPFALDLAMLNGFLVESGWNAYCAYEKDSLNIYTMIPGVMNPNRYICSANEPERNIFEECLRSFVDWNSKEAARFMKSGGPVYKHRIVN